VLGCEVATHLADAEVIIDTRRGDGAPGALFLCCTGD
jgi:hypothetical protein